MIKYTIRYDRMKQVTHLSHTIQYNTIRYDTIRYDTIKYAIQYDMIQYDTIRGATIILPKLKQYDTI